MASVLTPARTLAAVKRAVRPGQFWTVTNHFVTRPEHPGFGAIRSEIISVTSGGFRLSRHPDDRVGTEIRWPDAGRVRLGDGGAITISAATGGPFVTMVPAVAPRVARSA